MIDVVSGVVLFATDVEILTDLLAALVHHGLDDATEAKRHLVAFAFLAAELFLGGEVVSQFRIARDEAGRAVSPFLGIFGQRIFAGKFEAKAVDRSAGLFGFGC